MSNEIERNPGNPKDEIPLNSDEEFEEIEEEIDDPSDDNSSDENIAESEVTDDTSSVITSPTSPTRHRHSRKRRIKVKKRIRVKKKTSSKRFYKKLGERIIWVVFIIGFITALVILFKQLDITDEKYKNTKKRGHILHENQQTLNNTLFAENHLNQAANISSIYINSQAL